MGGSEKKVDPFSKITKKDKTAKFEEEEKGGSCSKELSKKKRGGSPDWGGGKALTEGDPAQSVLAGLPGRENNGDRPIDDTPISFTK